MEEDVFQNYFQHLDDYFKNENEAANLIVQKDVDNTVLQNFPKSGPSLEIFGFKKGSEYDFNFLKNLLYTTDRYKEKSIERLNIAGNCQIFTAITKKEEMNLILKIQIFPEDLDVKYFKIFQNELKINKKVQTFTKLYSLGIFEDYDFPLIGGKKIHVFEIERAEQSLKQIIDERKRLKQDFSEQEKNHMFWDLLNYLYLLHSNGIAHCDIKPANILFIKSENKFVLADFGISQDFTKDDLIKLKVKNPGSNYFMMKELLGYSLFYSAPEILNFLDQKQMYFDLFLADIFSLGLVFLEISSLNKVKSKQLRKRNNLPSLIHKFPIILEKDEYESFLKDETNVINPFYMFGNNNLDKIHNIRKEPLFASFDKRLNFRIKDFYEKKWQIAIKKLEDNGFFIEKQMCNFSFDEYIDVVWEIKNEETKEFLNLISAEGKLFFSAHRNLNFVPQNKTFCKKSNMNLLEIMLENDWKNRKNIFEIMLYYMSKKLYSFPKNPDMYVENHPNYKSMFFKGFSLKNCELFCSPFDIEKFTIDYHSIKEEFKLKERFIHKIYLEDVNRFFYSNSGIYVINLIKFSEEGSYFELKTTKSTYKNTKKILMEFVEPKLYEESLKIFAKSFEPNLIFTRKISFDLFPSHDEKKFTAKIRVTDIRGLEATILVKSLVTSSFSFHLIYDFLRKLIKHSLFLKTFYNGSSNYFQLAFSFDMTMLNYIHFFDAPHLIFDKYKNDTGMNFEGLYCYAYNSKVKSVVVQNKEFYSIKPENMKEFNFHLLIKNFHFDIFNDLNNLNDFSLKLEEYDLFDNVIGIEYAENTVLATEKISMILIRCLNLRVLDLAYAIHINDFLIASYLEKNSWARLKRLNLTDTSISSEILGKFNDNAIFMKSIRHLILNGCKYLTEESFLIKFIINPLLKLKCLGLNSVSCITSKFLNNLVMSNTKSHLKLLMFENIKNIDILEMEQFVNEILVNEEFALEKLTLSEDDISLITKLIEITKDSKRFLQIEPELFQDFGMEKNCLDNDFILNQNTMINIITKSKKNGIFLDDYIKKEISNDMNVVFSMIDFASISDFNSFFLSSFQNFPSFFIEKLTIMFCQIPPETLTVIFNNRSYSLISFDPSDIILSENELKEVILAELIEHYFEVRIEEPSENFNFIQINLRDQNVGFLINQMEGLEMDCSVIQSLEIFLQFKVLKQIKRFSNITLTYSDIPNLNYFSNFFMESIIVNPNCLYCQITTNIVVLLEIFAFKIKNETLTNLDIQVDSMEIQNLQSPINENEDFEDLIMRKIPKVFRNLNELDLRINPLFSHQIMNEGFLITIKKFVNFYFMESNLRKLKLEINKKGLGLNNQLIFEGLREETINIKIEENNDKHEYIEVYFERKQ